MKLIVGLGNPGLQYRRTRHNIGFLVVDTLAKERGLSFRRSRFRALTAEGQVGKEPVQLIKPITFMNLSGEAVAGVVHYHKYALDDVLVVYDDVNLDLGRLRLRRGGSAGGHNGVESVIKHLGTEEFPRLRLGVGRPPEWMDMMSYVLGAFPRAELKTVDETVARATLAVETWVYHGIDDAMNQFNG